MTFNGESPLGIPVPKSLACLPRQPPVCQFTTNDLRSLDLIRAFGKEFECREKEINQATNLASGPSDIIIILQRPASNHDYDVSFEKFVEDCKTLKAVDELIRFATKGTRSIHTVTILDAFMFKPIERVGIPDARCHQLLAEIIELKSPRLILRCHKESYNDSRLKLLEQDCEDYKCPIGRLYRDKQPTQYIVQSFHPSLAVNHKESRPEYRIFLLLNFTVAFQRLGGLHGKRNPRKFIRERCVSKEDQDSFEEQPDAAERIAYILNPALKTTISNDYTIRCIYRTKVCERNLYDNMYQQLVQLSISPQKLGAFEICRALRLWRHHFSEHCLSEQVISLLHYSGNGQTSWCRPKFPEGDEPDMDEITSGVSEMQVQGHSEGKTDLDDLHKRIKYAEKQCGIEESLKGSSLFNLTHSLKICRLVSWLKYQLQLLKPVEAKDGGLICFENEVASLIKASGKLEAMVEI